LVKNNKVEGVKTELGIEIKSDSVILTNGTFLNGIIYIGEKQFNSGRIGEKPSIGLTSNLVSLGIESKRMKTGTPVRIDGRSLDYSKMTEQKGDEEPKKFSFEPKAHWDLGKDLDIIDSERAGNVAGSRFTYIKGGLARLQFALVQFGLDVLTSEDTLKTIAEEANLEVSTQPFVPVIPPAMVKPAVLNRMARLEPREDRYYLEQDDLFLAGSAEHTIGSMHMDEVLDDAQLPLRYIGYSTSFRREAGSYGKDTKGILRQHQFDKMEMESFTKPEDALREQNFLVAIQEYMMRRLGLPHQVVLVCTGDMGAPDYRQMDIETWMPGQDTYRETHSSDYVASYQPRRLNTRYKNADGKLEFVHMNDATLFAMGRTLLAIMENYQNADGSITVPDALKPYTGNIETITV